MPWRGVACRAFFHSYHHQKSYSHHQQNEIVTCRLVAVSSMKNIYLQSITICHVLARFAGQSVKLHCTQRLNTEEQKAEILISLHPAYVHIFRSYAFSNAFT